MKESLFSEIWSIMILNNEYMDDAKLLRVLILLIYGFFYNRLLKPKLQLGYIGFFEKQLSKLSFFIKLHKIFVKILCYILLLLSSWFILRMSAYGTFCIIDWCFGPRTTRYWDFWLEWELRSFINKIGLEQYLTTPEAQSYLKTILTIKAKIETILEKIKTFLDKIKPK